jgi:hypothetical protein
MAYINLSAISTVATKRSLWRRIHWERVALLVVNFGLWALIAGMFT